MNLIPTGLIERWRTRARRGALMKLKSLLEFRELIEEYRAEGVLMAAYKEASEAMLISPETLRRDVATIREYPAERLVFWVQNGVSFDHLETANTLAEVAHKAPADLLDDAIDLGNGTGEVMSVRELQAHALGERPMPPPMYWVNRTLDGLCNSPTRLRLNWSEEKIHRLNELIEQIKELFR